MSNYPLFSVIGIEIEYMLVDRDTLDVRPLGDIILKELAGKIVNETVLGDIAISNELVLHVLELKNNGPKPINAELRQQFQQTLEQLQPILQRHNLCFMPTGAHPWMDPHTETKRWPHDNKALYEQFDKIFDCKGHGWANLQSMHVNLPFANDQEFFQLHTAIRLLLPLLPALAASTPILDSRSTGFQDTRLVYYANNQQKIPIIGGDVIPEFVGSIKDYQETILQPIYNAISPYDPDKLLQFEWVNSRGAIPKFAYNAIEIRLLDSQECVNADVAIALTIAAILKKWLQHSHYFLEHPCELTPLKIIYQQSLREGLSTTIDNRELLKQWQVNSEATNLSEVWSQLIEQVSSDLNQTSQKALEVILSQGNLSQRLLKAINGRFEQPQLTSTYRQLTQCLLDNKPFIVK